MKLTRSTYFGSPCWQLTGRWLWADADWNPRFPFGVGVCLRLGHHRDKHDLPTGPGFTLDINGSFGEPNRLYLWLVHWHVTIGLIEWHEFRETGREGRTVHGKHVRCRPHLVRAQAWDRKHGQWGDEWRWVTVNPANWRDRVKKP